MESNSNTEGSYYVELFELYDSIESPGTYCCAGILDNLFINPGLEIEGFGLIGLPLNEIQAKEIKKLCKLTPFGRKDKTIYDTSVRNTLQISPSKVTLSNPKWEEVLVHICTKISNELGLKSIPDCSLYKLLLYENGSFFKPHRDTEKEEGMFGTLVIQLPSKYEGGKLLVKHKGEEKVFDFSNDPFNISFTAFYADCEHEVKPITNGYRMCLVYNLIYSEDGPLPTAVDSSETRIEMESLLAKCKGEKKKQCAFMLEHQYTETALNWNQLKNGDRIRCRFLRDACQAAGYKLYLALLTISESTIDDEWDDACKAFKVHHCINPENKKEPIKDMYLREDEIYPFVDTEDMVPDGQHEGSPTGNEGTTMDRWYNRAVIILWPEENDFDIKLELSPDDFQQALVIWTEELVQNGFKDNQLHQKCQRVLNSLLRTNHYNMLTLAEVCLKLNEYDVLVSLLKTYSYYDAEVNSLIIKSFKIYGYKLLTQIKAAVSSKDDLLMKIFDLTTNSTSPDYIQAKDFVMQILYQNLQQKYYEAEKWFKLLDKIKDEKMTNLFIEKLTCQNDHGIQTQLKPLLERLASQGFSSSPVFKVLRDHCIGRYRAIIDKLKIPDAPATNVINTQLTCSCAQCKTVQAFLRSNQVEIQLKMNVAIGLHVSTNMQHLGSLVRLQRYGSSQQWVCRKILNEPRNAALRQKNDYTTQMQQLEQLGDTTEPQAKKPKMQPIVIL